MYQVTNWCLRFTQVDTIPYSQFEQLLDENKIAQVLVGQETVQGTLKEPFPDGRKGEVRVWLKRENDEGMYRLVVADNGAGLPESIELRKTTSLGLQLVTTLVDQLNGTIEVKRENGTGFIIRFSEMKARDTPGE
jgi:two-component sensor histidine kinase